MKTKIVMAVLSACALRAAGDEVNLSGTVVDGSSKAVAGVAVSLVGLDTTVYTDDAGAFAIVSNAGISGISGRASASLRISALANQVRLSGASDFSGYTLDAFRTDGRAVVRGLAFQNGVATLPNGSGSQMLLFNVRRNGALVSSRTGAARSSSSYSLVFAKSGYFQDTLVLSGTSASGIEKLLLDTSAWVPTASGLAHSRSQVLIKARGYSFSMGSTLHYGSDDDDFVSESPVHKVSFTKDFWMDTAEVTQALYDSVMTKHYGSYTALGWTSNYGKGANYPAYGITSFGGAVLFANARSALDGYDSVYTYSARDGVSGMAILTGLATDTSKGGYRLPTEAEWEYAARGGSSADFYWGGTYQESLTDSAKAVLSKYAVWGGNSYDLGLGESGYGSQPVASKLPNAYGIYDAIGNVWEWTSDYMVAYDSTLSHQVDPTGAASGSLRVRRGGCWGNSNTDYLRVANRQWGWGSLYDWIVDGLRTVRTAR